GTTTAIVAARGTIAATTPSVADAVIHFARKIEPRDTGFEATQASVPLSRSRMTRLATAKIATRMKNWAPTAAATLSSGAIETGGMSTASSDGSASRSVVLIQAEAAVRVIITVVTTPTTQARRP